MAHFDVDQGWAGIDPNLKKWHCPKCKESHLVCDWTLIKHYYGLRDYMEGRKCPKCDFHTLIDIDKFKALHEENLKAMTPNEDIS